MALTINILVITLLCCSIVAVIRLWSVLGSARTTLANLEETRLEANATLKQLSEVAASTDKVMREEVAPTLQKTRATLENVELATRALAQTTQSIRRLTGRAESVTTAQRLLSLGGAVAQNVFTSKTTNDHRNAAPTSAPKGVGFAFALVRGLLSKRSQPDEKFMDNPAGIERLNAANEVAMLLPAQDGDNVLTVGKDTPLMLNAKQSTKKR